MPRIKLLVKSLSNSDGRSGMWNWEQGRLHYFQYDELRIVSRFAVSNDLRNTPAQIIRTETGLDFPPNEYSPWRNYARVYKLCLVASDIDNVAVPTDVARILAMDGAVTCDEYVHFLVEATTSPSPALSTWTHNARIRHPLCFSLKYILAKIAVHDNHFSTINEIIGAYVRSDFDGGEPVEDFVALLDRGEDYDAVIASYRQSDLIRQARESIKFICQLSYLHTYRNQIIATLSQSDAASIFEEIAPLGGAPLPDRDEEIQRLAAHFKDGSVHDFFDYPPTTTSEVSHSGFEEGRRVQRSHIVIERNSQLRNLFYSTRPTATCQACEIDTHAKYPWTERVLDIHHLLPLSSGTRVDARAGTILEDLIAICPTCHRSDHRYYDRHLQNAGKGDFSDKAEALRIYEEARKSIVRT